MLDDPSRSSRLRIVMDIAGGQSDGAARLDAEPSRGADATDTIDQLMEAHGDALYSLCLRVLRDPAQAEDVLQQVFVEAHRDLMRFEGRSSLRTWLFGIAIHRCQDALKANRRLSRRIETDEDAVVAFEDPGDGPDGKLERQRQLADLAKCLGALSSDSRLAVLVRYQLGMSFDEMAVKLKAKSDTLQARVQRALPVLKRCLERKGWSDE
jgi:RNA polymerase sigma-70 factor (ECF subfamily)